MTKIFKGEDSASLKRAVNQWEVANIGKYRVLGKQNTEYSGVFYTAVHYEEVKK